MIIKSDWHIHSESSYDATLTLEEIAKRAKENGIEKIGKKCKGISKET